MISSDAIKEIIATYEKHGWLLRRLLLTSELKAHLEKNAGEILEGTDIRDSRIDAAWFSREPRPGGVAWEIRHLSNIPYALLENADEFAFDFDERLTLVEKRLGEAIGKAKPLTNPASGHQN